MINEGIPFELEFTTIKIEFVGTEWESTILL